ncbi:hypothetical protein PMIN03_010285 [Paraphaeosphaeria minitans]
MLPAHAVQPHANTHSLPAAQHAVDACRPLKSRQETVQPTLDTRSQRHDAPPEPPGNPSPTRSTAARRATRRSYFGLWTFQNRPPALHPSAAVIAFSLSDLHLPDVPPAGRNSLPKFGSSLHGFPAEAHSNVRSCRSLPRRSMYIPLADA